MPANRKPARASAHRNGSPTQLRAAWAIFVDFDGTITDLDTFDVLVRHFGAPGVWDESERDLSAGRITIREALQRQAACVRADYETVATLLARTTRIDPGFVPFVAARRACGDEVTVVSSGIEPLIRERLRALGLNDVPVIANGIDVDPAGWTMLFRDDVPNGTDKAAHVRAATQAGKRTIFIGDGRSDYDAAIAAERRFAKRGLNLERHLRERGLGFESFTSFADIGLALTRPAIGG